MWNAIKDCFCKINGYVDYKHRHKLTDTNNFLLKWRRGVVVITTAQLHSTKPKLRFCVRSNPARSVSEIRDGEDI